MSFKKNITKRVLAALAAVSMMFTAAGCGEGTSWAVKYGDYTANAGVFTYYQMEALKEAKSKIQEQDENADVSDLKKLKSMTVDGVDIEEWVNTRAKEKVKKFVAVSNKFDELGLELSSDDQANIDYYVEYGWMYGEGETCEKIGTSKDSYKQIIEFSYKEKQVFSHFYGEGGEKEYPEEDYNKYLADNLSRVKMLQFELKDGDGNALDAAGKAEVKAQAEDYLKRANSGESMDKLIKEYEKLKEEEKAEETQTDDTAEAPEVTTAADDSTEEPAVTTVPETENAEPEVTEAVTSEADTKETAEVTTAASENEIPEVTTTVSEIEAPEVTTTAPAENTSEEPAVTTEAAETSEPADAEDTDDSADPYENENLYFKGSDEEGYSPSQKANDAIFNECKVGGEAVLVEDDDNSMIYVISRLDIAGRTDFTEGDYKDYILWKILEDDFNQFIMSWISDSEFKENNAAYRRYDAFKSEE